MSELWFKLGASCILGSLLFTAIGLGIYMMVKAVDWIERLFGAIVILLGISSGFFIALLWSVGIRGLE